jgi:5,10-methylenetetrahydromethanopterin reductase
MVNIGMCFDRTFPAAAVSEFATKLEAGGVEQLWVIEDCFYTAGIALAATALARTEHLTVGLGIVPAVARNAAITAMEIATLANLAPGRLLAGIGHGVQEWMEQMGARTPSPVTTLAEVISNVRRLLAGERVTFAGRHVRFTDVQLDQPPSVVPPVLAGVRGPKSLALAGRVADGIVLAEGAGPAYIRHALEQAACDTVASPNPFRVSVFTVLCTAPERKDAYRWMAPLMAEWIGANNPAFDIHPNGDDIKARFAAHGLDGLIDMPADYWRELGGIGTFDDAVAHVEALAKAGANDVALFPAPELDVARLQIDDVIKIRAAVTR